MNSLEKSRLMVAGAASLVVNLFVWLAVSQSFVSEGKAQSLPPAEIHSVSQKGDGQVKPEVIVDAKTGKNKQEVAGVPMDLPAARELEKARQNPVQPLSDDSNKKAAEQARKEVEAALKGYKQHALDDSNVINFTPADPPSQGQAEENSNTDSVDQPQSQAGFGAPTSQAPNSDPMPLSTADIFIRDDLLALPHKRSVKVKVDIQANGSFNVTLESSTGVPEIDQVILGGLKAWHWRPAYRQGTPVASTKRWEYFFESRS